MAKMDWIVAIILLLSLVFFKVWEGKKHKKETLNTSFHKGNFMVIGLFALSVLLFVVALLINVLVDGNQSSKTVVYILNAFSVALLVMPFSLLYLYSLSKEKEKLLYVKCVVTNQFEKKLFAKFKKAGIHVLLLTKEKTDLKWPVFKEEDVDGYKKKLNQNLVIETDNLKLLHSYLSKETTCFEFKDLERLYQEIRSSRGTYDNYLRTIQYLVTTYLPLILSYFIFCIFKFPAIYSLVLVLLLKVFTISVSRLVYKNLAFDVDIMERKPLIKREFFRKQDVILLVIQSFFQTFVLCIPYMLILAQGGTQEFANTLFYTIFIYENIFMTMSYLSEENIFKDLLKIRKNGRVFVYVLLGILFTIFISYNGYFGTRNVELHNYLSCILFGFVPVLFHEFLKFARFMTKKGKKKNEFKNNKKSK